MVDPKATQKFVQQQIQQPQQPKVGVELVYNFIGDPTAAKENATKIETKPIRPEADTATTPANNNNNTSIDHNDNESESEEVDESDEYSGEEDGVVSVSKESQQQYPTTTAHKYVLI